MTRLAICVSALVCAAAAANAQVQVETIPLPPPGLTQGASVDVNDAGQVLVHGFDLEGPAYLWEAGAFVTLGIVGQTFLNEAGQASGSKSRAGL